jgi:hypothetical protein
MSKPGKQPRPKPPQTEQKQGPFYLGVSRNKRTLRLTDKNGIRKGGF